ncbi:class I SAM-dependent rRNA methyltransferase [Limisphaera ngatamarikiensis]|uniref:Class I SAM-dependent rRNA methyltransferase n=1 Tax=Limisphaera ngatamarikiensis TaxID=1324935 RepID=A0A6M1RQQ0_9BACT|nr:class I SAM-dependent methyltransferase [Limisphaera ngatamarikiensis]NGO39707.1 class I SAM-dependent rRNA methyltransferase [Limisphaera ngatamarikiensis]
MTAEGPTPFAEHTRQVPWEPSPTGRPVHIRLKPAAADAVRTGHPWVFDQSIQKQDRPGQPGELAALYDRNNRFLAIGLYDPHSPLRVRILHRGTPVPLDESWWRQHLRRALTRREPLFDPQTTGYRLVHGESDGWPGLVLDRYAEVLVLKLYTVAWLPRLQALCRWITDLLQPRSLVLRLSRNLQSTAPQFGGPTDGSLLHGTPIEPPVPFLESGLRFTADVLRGQKTGFFLDQRENRRRVETLAQGRHVLNLFSFSGGFSVYAARGGARSVTDLDLSPHALDAARRHFDLNRGQYPDPECPHRTVQADAFEWLETAPPESFDLVILDPPALARKAAERAGALRAYRHLVLRSVRLLRPDGILVAASCTAHVRTDEFFDLVRQTLRSTGRPWRELATTTVPPDHPATFPEAEYLKCIYVQVGGPARRPRRSLP